MPVSLISDSNTPESTALGFLTVLDDPQDGLFGGYLTLNLLGRPLEFHCTAPIRPNRAQEILYGPTLEPYLYGEQIGETLVSRAKIAPLVVCTDQRPALALGQRIDVPVVLVLPPSEPDGDSEPADLAQAAGTLRLDSAHVSLVGLAPFQVGRNHLAVPAGAEGYRRAAAERRAALAETFDLAEPFGRIREAIEEARCGAH